MVVPIVMKQLYFGLFPRTIVLAIFLGMLVLTLNSLGITGFGFIVCIYVLISAYLSWRDYLDREIPNTIVYPFMLLACIGGAVILDNGFLNTLAGSSIGFILFFPIWAAPRLTLGSGDIKLSVAIGALCGFPKAVLAFGISISFLIPVVIGILILRSNIVDRGLPMAPFLSIGGLVALLWGENIMLWYTALLNSS